MVDKGKDAERLAYLRGLGARGRSLARRSRMEWEGEPAAIYCRISHTADEDQTGVDRQEVICRKTAEHLGLVVAPEHVLVDNNRSAWSRSRKRPGWDTMLELVRRREVRHLIAYHPDRLMRQPKDLEALLDLADEWEITVHGQANRRDLSDPDDRFFLRLEVAHACRTSDDTSRRMADDRADRAHDRLPRAGGPRRFGYSPNGLTLVPAEATIVEEVFAAYIDGMSPYKIARMLNDRGSRRVRGGAWSATAIREMLDNPYVAGIHMFRGEEIGDGAWPAIIDRGMWDEVRQARTVRAARWHAEHPGEGRYYLLRGLITCGKCGARMVGQAGVTPRYVCSRTTLEDSARCLRSIRADKTESFVADAAVTLLETLDLTGAANVVLSLSQAAQEAISKAEQDIRDLRVMWQNKEITTVEFREMRATREKEIRTARGSTRRRPAGKVLDGMAGPNARASWTRLEQAQDYERMNAILRFLFATVTIGEWTHVSRTFEYTRISITPAEL
ncbi:MULTISPECIES: recombinase family protein [Frankia]|uniref:Recombinase domain-containing protein n=1 Tax=Frankia alni (strain DSM 45986 / CECT 9034 / ACN14a) TaxID=326424 RepID=Q0RLN1_FRAAA|nr:MULTISPECIES: recombinase family protein [Frankia]CAJ61573.1 hypothetical protein FRAAL2929 [Frankia alni ACN14a]